MSHRPRPLRATPEQTEAKRKAREAAQMERVPAKHRRKARETLLLDHETQAAHDAWLNERVNRR
jgi:hypothetical protein